MKIFFRKIASYNPTILQIDFLSNLYNYITIYISISYR
nr:MAG TPA: hypothetical protein [Caudoviricetes sp.]